jgi:hypothetical protein
MVMVIVVLTCRRRDTSPITLSSSSCDVWPSLRVDDERARLRGLASVAAVAPSLPASLSSFSFKALISSWAFAYFDKITGTPRERTANLGKLALRLDQFLKLIAAHRPHLRLHLGCLRRVLAVYTCITLSDSLFVYLCPNAYLGIGVQHLELAQLLGLLADLPLQSLHLFELRHAFLLQLAQFLGLFGQLQLQVQQQLILALLQATQMSIKIVSYPSRLTARSSTKVLRGTVFTGSHFLAGERTVALSTRATGARAV